MRPSIEHQRMREAALETGFRQFLLEHPKYRVIDRERTRILVGYRTLIGGYDFKRIAVDDTGEVTAGNYTGNARYAIRKFKETKA